MELKLGRLIDHVHLRAIDLKATLDFYEAVLDVLGVPVNRTADHLQADELWIDASSTPTHVHLAFQTPDRATVDRFHAVGLAAGGRDNGGPGERPYHPGYYACFLLDPDGNNIEAVHHGTATRSTDAVTVTAKLP